MSPSLTELEEARDRLQKTLDVIVISIGHTHMEMADFMQEYGKSPDSKAGYTSKADLREKEDKRAKQFAKAFKTATHSAKSAEALATLHECFDQWERDLLPIAKKKLKGELSEEFIDIPLKMAGLFFYHGDYYRAILCLKAALVLMPFNFETRCLLLKWTVYLGEWEMAEDCISYEKKAQKKYKLPSVHKEQLDALVRVCTAYVQFNRNNEREEAMKVILDELERLDKEKLNTFGAMELGALVRFMCSQFAKLPDVPETTVDSLHCTIGGYTKCDILLRNRLRGIYQEDSRLDIVGILKDPVACVEALATFAEYCDAVRSSVLEHFNLGIVRDAFAFAEAGLKISYKMGCFSRVLEFSTLCVLVLLDTSPDSASVSLAVARARLHILTTADVRSYSPSRCKSPSRMVSSAAQKLMESFDELRISDDTPVRRLHYIGCKSSCDICTAYFTNPSFAITYHLLMLLYHGLNEQSMLHMTDQFTEIRNRVMPLQKQILKKNVRPRPPLWMCEAVCVASVRWMRHWDLQGREHLVDTRKADARKTVLDSAFKAAQYSQIRLICYLLALRHFKRQDSLGEADVLRFSWMTPTTAEKEKEMARYAKVPRMQKNSAVVTRAVKDAMEDYSNFYHLFYRDWRFPICTFIARLTSDPWQSAHMWTESTILSTRQQARLVSGKIDMFAFSRSGSFESAMKGVPRDYTVVQLATDDLGNLWLIKLHSERNPVILPLCHRSRVARVRERMFNLMKANDASGNVNEGTITPSQFWAKRRQIDKELKEIVKSVETYLFKPWTPLLLPSHSFGPVGKEIASRLVNLTLTDGCTFDNALAEELLSVAIYYDSHSTWKEIVAKVGEYCNMDSRKVKILQDEFPKVRKRLTSETGTINHQSTMFTFLVLCPILSSVPFETMDVYNIRPHVGRIVSLHALFRQILKAPSLPRRVDVGNSFYILDPDNSLTATQKRMTEFLEKLQLKGIVGTAPSMAELKNILESKDMFFFLGHGSGSKHMSRRVIKESSCNAVSVLMGCSSVNLDYDGWGLDGKCTVYDYTIAHCPAVVGCLWMVTDGEIDRYFMALVQSCFSTGANTTMDGGGEKPRLRNLMDAMRKAREQSKLPYLTGASVVGFGLPITSSE